MKQLDDLFYQAKRETPKVAFEETKVDFVTSLSQISTPSSQNGTSYLFTTKTWTIMITTIFTTIGFTALFLMVESTPLAESKNYTNEQSISLIANSDSVKFPMELENNSIPLPLKLENNLNLLPIIISRAKPIIMAENDGIILPSREKEFQINASNLVLYSDTSAPEEVYRFPILTEEEIKENHKQKARMIKELVRHEKGKKYGKYVLIPRGSFEYQKSTVSVNSFFMQGSEVSNLEYRTFLFDLLIQNKKEAFAKAKPDQSQWTKFEGHNVVMKQMYFSHPFYNSSPVNNISREGAEMYCKWLTQVTNQQLSNKGKTPVNEVRIPSNMEWTFAAKGGLLNSPYPWGGPSYTTSNGCYLANYYPEEGVDADGGSYLVDGYSYAPNGYGLWCMSGNVAEMVYYENDKSKPGARGGSWNSSLEEIKIDGSDPFKGVTTPNVNIGFRVVISYVPSKVKWNKN